MDVLARQWYRRDVDPSLPEFPPLDGEDPLRLPACHRPVRVVCAVLHVCAMLATALVLLPVRARDHGLGAGAIGLRGIRSERVLARSRLCFGCQG